MSIQKPIILSLLVALLFAFTLSAQAASVNFGGLVLPKSSDKEQVVNFGTVVVSFSDKVLLPFPHKMEQDGAVTVFQKAGEYAKGAKMLTLKDKTQVVMVDLQPKARQILMICKNKLCIRYKVARM